jgi:malonate transporter
LSAVGHLATLTAPLFLLVLIGYVLSRFGGWPRAASDGLTRFVFSAAIPAFLFRLMSDFAKLPPVDARLLLAFFGGCFIVFLLARGVARSAFRMDAVQQSVFGIGTVFANTVLLGIPMAQIVLPPAAMPAVTLVIVFNALVLWTLVTVSVEWARNRDLSLAGFGRTATRVMLNPVVAGILLGTAWGFTGWTLPAVLDRTLALVSAAAVPLSLIALGMGLAEYGVRAGWQASAAIAALKLVVQPAVVYALARLIGLPPLETLGVTMLASMPVGANVYLMARQFGALEGPVASSLVLSTLCSAATTPVVLALIGAGTP